MYKKTREQLLDQLYRFEGIMGKYNCQNGGTKCEFQKAFHRLIRREIDILKNPEPNDDYKDHRYNMDNYGSFADHLEDIKRD
jgi:hypothetical protein